MIIQIEIPPFSFRILTTLFCIYVWILFHLSVSGSQGEALMKRVHGDTNEGRRGDDGGLVDEGRTTKVPDLNQGKHESNVRS